MPDGNTFTKETERLTPGWRIVLPADATTSEADDTSDTSEVTRRAGDNFWTIAETALEVAWDRAPGNGETAGYWRSLIEANRDRLVPPHDPNLILSGQTFTLPPIPTDPATEPASPQVTDEGDREAVVTVTVTPGNSFWSIAETVLADAWHRAPATTETAEYWRELVDVNRDRLRPPHDPNLIYPGQVFTLPTVPADARSSGEPVDSGEPSLRPVPQPERADDLSDKGPGADLPPLATVPAPAETPKPITADTSTPHTTLTRPESPPRDGEPVTTDTEADTRAGRDLLPSASTLAGLGILAAGLVALLRRLRRAQLRHRRPNSIPTPAASRHDQDRSRHPSSRGT